MLGFVHSHFFFLHPVGVKITPLSFILTIKPISCLLRIKPTRVLQFSLASMPPYCILYFILPPPVLYFDVPSPLHYFLHFILYCIFYSILYCILETCVLQITCSSSSFFSPPFSSEENYSQWVKAFQCCIAFAPPPQSPSNLHAFASC